MFISSCSSQYHSLKRPSFPHWAASVTSLKNKWLPWKTSDRVHVSLESTPVQAGLPVQAPETSSLEIIIFVICMIWVFKIPNICLWNTKLSSVLNLYLGVLAFIKSQIVEMPWARRQKSWVAGSSNPANFHWGPSLCQAVCLGVLGWGNGKDWETHSLSWRPSQLGCISDGLGPPPLTPFSTKNSKTQSGEFGGFFTPLVVSEILRHLSQFPTGSREP